MKTKRLLTLLVGVIFHFRFAIAQPITSAQIDALVQRVSTTFQVPGIAVAIIKDKQIVYIKAYGVRSLNTRQSVDENTLFGIGSNSKAFTTAALAMLVDEAKLTWDDKVTKYIPEFQMYDPCVTGAFTIRDLLTHRSGLGLGAGDLMIVLDSSDFKPKDLVRAFRYLKPVSNFRTKYDYDNILYMVAGEVIERVSGKTWTEFVEERIMKPLQMNRSRAAYNRFPDNLNNIDPHIPINGKAQVSHRRYIQHMGYAAGGINSSITDMGKWVLAQLNQGKFGTNSSQQIFSEKSQVEMWSPQTIMPLSPVAIPPYNTHFYAYGLGWRLSDVKGYKQVSHNGGVPGMVSQVLLLPELEFGLVILTNQQSIAAISAISNTIKDSYLGIPASDWVSKFSTQEKKEQAEADSITRTLLSTLGDEQKMTTSPIDFSAYAGTYRDPWFGDVELSQQGNKWVFHSVRSPKLTGEIFASQNNTFIVKWKDRTLDADAYLTFRMNDKKKPVAIKMKAISPLTDFSFDFQDLDLQRVNP